MKGLLLKDFYCIKGYLSLVIISEMVMIALASFMRETVFLLFFACVISAMIGTSLMAYEEKERWSKFALTLPLSRKQIVSEKYVLGLITGGITAAIILIAQSVSMIVKGEFSSEIILENAVAITPICLLPNAISLPFVWKLGVEKGKFAYYIIIGMLGGSLGFVTGFFEIENINFSINTVSAVLVLAATAALYAVSWFISIAFYSKREL